MIFDKPWRHRKLSRNDLPYRMHPWIEEGTSDWTSWVPNPARPVVLDLVDGAAVNLENAPNPVMSSGDIVWVSFYIQVILSGSGWGPTFIPLDIVRVGTIPQQLRTQDPYQMEDGEPVQRSIRAGDTFTLRE